MESAAVMVLLRGLKVAQRCSHVLDTVSLQPGFQKPVCLPILLQTRQARQLPENPEMLLTFINWGALACTLFFFLSPWQASCNF